MSRHLTGKSIWLRVGVLSLVAVLGVALGYRIALAETEYYGAYVNGIWQAEEAYTSGFYTDQDGDYNTDAWTFPYYCYGTSCVGEYADFLYLESRSYNASGGWHLILDIWNTEEPGECVYHCLDTGPVSVYAWQCATPAICCCPPMYTAAYHYEALYSNGPYFSGYTSSDGQHSSAMCYDYAGC